MRCCAYPGLSAKSCLQESIAFQKAKPNTFQKNTVTLLDLEEMKTRYQKPLTHKSFVTKSLGVARKHLPNLMEGDIFMVTSTYI